MFLRYQLSPRYLHYLRSGIFGRRKQWHRCWLSRGYTVGERTCSFRRLCELWVALVGRTGWGLLRSRSLKGTLVVQAASLKLDDGGVAVFGESFCIEGIGWKEE